MVYLGRPKIKESPEDIAMQEAIRTRANYSLAILGRSFVYRGGGYFINIRSPKEQPRRVKSTKCIDNAV